MAVVVVFGTTIAEGLKTLNHDPDHSEFIYQCRFCSGLQH
jgi:hypothetical protein